MTSNDFIVKLLVDLPGCDSGFHHPLGFCECPLGNLAAVPYLNEGENETLLQLLSLTHYTQYDQ